MKPGDIVSNHRGICAICGDQATKLRYSHYGASSCFSCRAFYRRAIEKESYTNYICRAHSEIEGGFCAINVSSRKKCASCRFRKCQSVGMRHLKSSISTKDTDETNSEIEIKIEPEVENESTTEMISNVCDDFPLQEQEESDEEKHFRAMIDIPLLSSGIHSICFTQEESKKVQLLLKVEKESLVTFGDSLREQNRTIMKKFLIAVFTGNPLEFSATCWGYVCGILKLTRFAQAIPEFSEVTENQMESKKCILLNNLDPMFNIRSAFFFQPDSPSFICQLDRFGIFDLTVLKKICSTLFSHDLANSMGPMHWNQYFVTPWANSIEHELQFDYLLSCLHDLKLDYETACLLSVVALFSTEGLPQNQSSILIGKIRDIQNNFSLLLFRYLVDSRGRSEATRLFPAFMSTLTKLREMAEILKNKTIKIWPTPSVEQYLDLFMDSS